MDTYSELQRRIKALQQQAEQVRRNEVASVVADIEAKMQEFGITVDDLVGARRDEPKKIARARCRQNIAVQAPVKPGRGEAENVNG
ncbi:MAG: binding protein nucleoid-associated [Herminiimonas sp.]|nr:binding protein nucleoid-associated [Herminiimonas sp.]